MGAGASTEARLWFQRDFGFFEEEYHETQLKFKYDGNLLISSEKEDRSFIAGRFETPSLEELRSKATSMKGKLKGKLVVTEIVDDVSRLHVQPENKFAIFQAASQFNCLEHTSENGKPSDGIACYARDHTQGPACAITCAPGTIVRNYFAFDALHGKDNKLTPGQTMKNQVRNLSGVETVLQNTKNEFFRVQSGYTMASNESLGRLQSFLLKGSVKDAVMEKLRIGLQWDTEVINSKFGDKKYEGSQQLVTQAYCSAVSVSYSGCNADKWEPFARLILSAAYEATLYAAVLNAQKHPDEPGAKRVFLTCLGGGVFGNPVRWITDAMDRAFEKFKDCDLNVFVVSYGRSDPDVLALQER